jgi:hypothetical protein
MIDMFSSITGSILTVNNNDDIKINTYGILISSCLVLAQYKYVKRHAIYVLETRTINRQIYIEHKK